MTSELFRQDGYLKSCDAMVVSVDEQGICVDQTVFYPRGGGQPGDAGHLIRANGDSISITDTRKDNTEGLIWHLTDNSNALPAAGEAVKLELDWVRRHRLMRMHSCLHLLCAVVAAPVTGGSIRDDGSARLDFNLPEPPDKVALEKELNHTIIADHPMSLQWVSEQALQDQPDLVKTLSVKPPMGIGKIRLVQFGDVDHQPCGGTHVAASGEIGPVRIMKIEKKGKINRRITIEFA